MQTLRHRWGRLRRRWVGWRRGGGLAAAAADAAQRADALVAAAGTGEGLRQNVRPDETAVSGDAPLVSVIVATRNDPSTIERSVASILGQSWRRLEVVLVDDASDAPAQQAIDWLAARDGRVRVCRNAERQGAARSRNIGLAEARGDFATFQDGDDWSTPDRIARQLAPLAAGRAVLSLCDYVRIAEGGALVSVNDRLNRKCVISMMFPLARARAEVGFFRNEPVSEDADYYERLKAAFGAGAERQLFDVLYFAGFRQGSAFFSSGAGTKRQSAEQNSGVQKFAFDLAPDAATRLAALEVEWEEMRAGVRSPFIGAPDAASEAPAAGGPS